MTGTSLDGVDTAICEFVHDGTAFKQKVLFFKTYKYSDEIRVKIVNLISNDIQISEISQLNFALSKIYADCIEFALIESGIERKSIKAIGMHGQTIWHQPIKSDFCALEISSTLQLGNISALRQFIGLPVIGDFRSADIALDGQGAPLVPIFDYCFLRSISDNVIALNIGGIANITYLPKNCNRNQIIAFDTGPGNMLIDIAMKRFYGKDYDSNGHIARSGKTDHKMLEQLMNIAYINQAAPKSTGRELFNYEFFDKYIGDNSNHEDIINTLTHFTAKSIARNIDVLCKAVDSIYVSGGGAHNSYIIDLLKANIPNSKIMLTEQIGIGIDSKEAVCFAFLAYLYDLGMTGNIISATGASSEAILGCKSY